MIQIAERNADHRFTYAYSQPAEYHFCQDSVILPRFVADRLPAQIPENFRALDLCAGCGVIGFELAHYRPSLKEVDFVEVQEIFRPHFEENLKITGRDFRFLQMNYSQMLTPEFAGRYDLIVANPPYFYPGEGKPSPCEVKNRARFFIDADFSALISVIRHSLKLGGSAYILVKPGHLHGRDSINDIRCQSVAAEVVADIRGTQVFLISK